MTCLFIYFYMNNWYPHLLVMYKVYTEINNIVLDVWHMFFLCDKQKSIIGIQTDVSLVTIMRVPRTRSTILINYYCYLYRGPLFIKSLITKVVRFISYVGVSLTKNWIRFKYFYVVKDLFELQSDAMRIRTVTLLAQRGTCKSSSDQLMLHCAYYLIKYYNTKKSICVYIISWHNVK